MGPREGSRGRRRVIRRRRRRVQPAKDLSAAVRGHLAQARVMTSRRAFFTDVCKACNLMRLSAVVRSMTVTTSLVSCSTVLHCKGLIMSSYDTPCHHRVREARIVPQGTSSLRLMRTLRPALSTLASCCPCRPPTFFRSPASPAYHAICSGPSLRDPILDWVPKRLDAGRDAKVEGRTMVCVVERARLRSPTP